MAQKCEPVGDADARWKRFVDHPDEPPPPQEKLGVDEVPDGAYAAIPVPPAFSPTSAESPQCPESPTEKPSSPRSGPLPGTPPRGVPVSAKDRWRRVGNFVKQSTPAAGAFALTCAGCGAVWDQQSPPDSACPSSDTGKHMFEFGPGDWKADRGKDAITSLYHPRAASLLVQLWFSATAPATQHSASCGGWYPNYLASRLDLAVHSQDGKTMNKVVPKILVINSCGVARQFAMTQTRRETSGEALWYVNEDPAARARELQEMLRGIRSFHDPEYASRPSGTIFQATLPLTEYDLSDEAVPPEAWQITPETDDKNRIQYRIVPLEGFPAHSASVTSEQWGILARKVQQEYSAYDAFIIIHGLDTMAYTASALSFMLQNLGKSVILTGAQVPLSQARNDAFGNLLGALLLAGRHIIPEVTVWMNHNLYRGNRITKTKVYGFDTFDSPAFPPLGEGGVNFQVMYSRVWRTEPETFSVSEGIDPRVIVVHIYPGLDVSFVQAMLEHTQARGMVLLTYSAGILGQDKAPLLSLIRQIGYVTADSRLSAGYRLEKDFFVVPGYFFSSSSSSSSSICLHDITPRSDMTLEAAVTKLQFLLGCNPPLAPDEIRRAIKEPISGELTRPKLEGGPPAISATGSGPAEGTMGSMTAEILGGVSGREYISSCILMQQIMDRNYDSVEALLKKGTVANKGSGLSTPLHVAVRTGMVPMVQLLLKHEAQWSAEDAQGRNALLVAVLLKEFQVARVLRQHGADLGLDGHPQRVYQHLSQAVLSDDVGQFRVLHECGADVRSSSPTGDTALHLAISLGRIRMVQEIVNMKEAHDVIIIRNCWGRSCLDEAEQAIAAATNQASLWRSLSGFGRIQLSAPMCALNTSHL
eukprot:gene5274-943_t